MECFTMESAPPSPTFELEEGVDFETGKEDTISMQSVQSTQVWLSLVPNLVLP